VAQASYGMSARLDLTAGTSSSSSPSVVQTATSASASGVHDPLVHGYLSAVSVGLLLPLSIVLARNFKELAPAVRSPDPDLLRRPILVRALLFSPFARFGCCCHASNMWEPATALGA